MFSLVIADDELHQRQGLANYIHWESLGYEVKGCFADGAEVMRYLEDNHVDVIFTDINMSPVSGMEIAEYAYKHCPDTSVVFISGYKEFEFAQKALEYNVHGYIIKPAQIEDICRVFKELAITLTRARQSHEEAPPKEDAVSQGTADSVPDLVIQKARRYIDENYAKDISLDEVADSVHLNPIYFSRFFKQKTGENFINYVVSVRMNRAMALLKGGEHKVYEISEMVGYKSVKYFSRVFKQTTGYSPADYAQLSNVFVE